MKRNTFQYQHQVFLLTSLFMFCFALAQTASTEAALSRATVKTTPVKATRTLRESLLVKADRLVQQGKELLVAGDTQGAQSAFQAAVALKPNHEEANFYLGSVRIMNVYEGNPAAFSLLVSYGFKGAGGLPATAEEISIFHFLAEIPRRENAEGLDYSTDSPRLEEVKAFAFNELEPEIAPAFRNFSRVSKQFVSYLEIPGFLFFETPVEFDFSDVLLALASLHSLKAALHLLEAYNVEGDFDDLYFKAQDNTLDYRRDFLEADPGAFAVVNSRATAAMTKEITRAINFYLKGSDAIRLETDSQDDDFMHFDPLDQEAEQLEIQFRSALMEIRASLNRRYGMLFPQTEVHLKDLFLLGRFFRNAIDFRSFEQTEGVVDFLSGPLGTETHYAYRTLAGLAPEYIQRFTPEDIGTAHPIEFDFTDVLLGLSALDAWRMVVMLAESYEHNLDAAELFVRFTEGTLDWTEVLAEEYPDFGLLIEPRRAARTRHLLLRAADEYLAASDAIYAETDDQSDDAITLEGKDVEGEAHFRQVVQAVSDLEGFIAVPSGSGNDLAYNLNAYFDAPFDVRPLFPLFEGATYVPGTFLDPTLKGVIPSVDNDDLTDLFGIPD